MHFKIPTSLKKLQQSKLRCVNDNKTVHMNVCWKNKMF